MPKMWDSSDRKFTQTSIPAAQKVSFQKFMLDNRIMPNSVLIKDEYYKTSQIMAMFSCTVSSLRRNLNQKNRLEDNGLLYRSPSAWKIIELIFAIRDFLSEISAKFLKVSNREISWKFRFTKVEDQDTAIILKWPEMVAVVLVLTLLLGGGQGPTPELWFCLWLSFIQITESCIWEPWTGSPAIPKLGKTGTQQDSKCYLALFACQVASRWTSDQWWCQAGTLRLVVARTVADIFGSFGMTCYSLLSHCYVSKIGEILPLFCPLNWRQTCL